MDDSFRGTRTVTAIFDTSAEAERAVDRLRAAGVPDDQIRVTAGAGTSYSDVVDYDDPFYRTRHRGFWDALADFFLPDEDRYAYAEGLTRGAQLVTVTGFDPMLHERIADILDDEGSVDLDTREAEWRAAGWSGYEGSDYYRESGTAAGIGRTIGNAVDRAGDALAHGADRVGDALTGDQTLRGFVAQIRLRASCP